MFDELINSDGLYLVDDVGWQMVNPGKLPIRPPTLMVGPRSPFFFVALPGRYELAVPFFWEVYMLVPVHPGNFSKHLDRSKNDVFNLVTSTKDFWWCPKLLVEISIHENLRIPEKAHPPIERRGLIRSHQRTMMANNPFIRPNFFFWRWGGIGGEVTLRFP